MNFIVFIVPSKRALLVNTNSLGNYFTFKTLNEKLILRKVSKNFLVSLNATCSLFSVLSDPLYVERGTFCRTWGYGVSLFSNTQTGVRQRRNNPYLEKSIDINSPCSSHLKGSFQ